MVYTRLTKRLIVGALATLCITIAAWTGIAIAAEPGQSKTAGGLTVYLGVLPAELVKGPGPHSAEKPMHGRIPKGPREYHVVAAIFDAASGARVVDAVVAAQVSGLSLSGPKKKLEPMEIEKTITYGGFFDLPGRDIYTVRLEIVRPGATAPVTVNFKYDRR